MKDSLFWLSFFVFSIFLRFADRIPKFADRMPKSADRTAKIADSLKYYNFEPLIAVEI
jgi:hypothetical protein